MQISAIGLTSTVLLGFEQYGWDRHIYDVRISLVGPTLKVAMAAKVLFTAAATFTRLSLLFFYYRLIQDSGKNIFRWAVHINVVYSIGIFIAFICLSIFPCHPVSLYWTYGAPPGSCLNEGAVTLAAGIINCIADFFCTVTPIPMVAKLQMPRRQRIAVVFLFSLGFIVTIAGIVRTYYIDKAFVDSYDLTWYAWPLWIAATLEIDIGVICASAPVLRPLISKIPISLSDVIPTIPSRHRSGGYLSEGSKINRSGTTLQGSRNGQSKPISNQLEGQKHPGEHLELRPWEDVEGGAGWSKVCSVGSQDVILEGEEESRGKRPVTSSYLSDQGLAATSEEDARLSSVSTRSSVAIHP